MIVTGHLDGDIIVSTRPTGRLRWLKGQDGHPELQQEWERRRERINGRDLDEISAEFFWLNVEVVSDQEGDQV